MSWQEKVHPELAKRVTQIIESFARNNKDVRVVQSLRTFAEQDALYAKGRTKPGKRVTNARGGQSNHNYGLAVDLCPFVNGQPDWNDLATFKEIGYYAAKVDLEWGGNWATIKDMPHVQLKGMSLKECQYHYAQGGIKQVWYRIGSILSGSNPIPFEAKDDDLVELNDRGAEVLKIQQRLVQLGLLRSHEVDGVFGKVTKNAVSAFQRINNLTADGIVGDDTKAKLYPQAQTKPQEPTFDDGSTVDAFLPPKTATGGLKTQTGSLNIDSEHFPAVGSIQEPILDVETNRSSDNPQKPLNENVPSQPATANATVSKTEETPTGTETKTVSTTTDLFIPQNIPAFIPRMNWKDYALGLLPGGGILTAIGAYLAKMPDWLILLIGAIAGIGLWCFFQYFIKHREKVLEFINNCYKVTADPTQHNLIPTDSSQYVGQRGELIIKSLSSNGEQR